MKKDTQMVYYPVYQTLKYICNGEITGGLTGPIAEREFSKAIKDGKTVKIGRMGTKSTKIRRLRAIWIKLGIDDNRHSILESYGVRSTAQLTERQLDELIKKYSGEIDPPKEVRRARSVVIMLLQDIGVYKNDGNWDQVNRFLMNKKIAGKLLYAMSLQELKTLTKKLRSIKRKAESEKKFNPNLN